jgi:hypothetical protein
LNGEIKKARNNLLPYAQNALGPGSGIPWNTASVLSAMDKYTGVVKGSSRSFRSGVVFYESKFDIDNDGIGGNVDNDPKHNSDTSLHDLADDPLDATKYPYIVLPLPNDGSGFSWVATVGNERPIRSCTDQRHGDNRSRSSLGAFYNIQKPHGMSAFHYCTTNL